MIGIYFSGTGNTKYCLEKFVALYDRNIEITPLEDEGTIEKVKHHKDIIFAYPIYYSNLPKIVRDFICENSDAWKGKHKLNNMPNNLSGGQQQRVAIARALVSKPAIVLADEPTGNLDSKTSADVLGLLKTTSQKFHQTLVMITHNSEIAQLADRIIRIEDGKIVQ